MIKGYRGVGFSMLLEVKESTFRAVEHGSSYGGARRGTPFREALISLNPNPKPCSFGSYEVLQASPKDFAEVCKASWLNNPWSPTPFN